MDNHHLSVNKRIFFFKKPGKKQKANRVMNYYSCMASFHSDFFLEQFFLTSSVITNWRQDSLDIEELNSNVEFNLTPGSNPWSDKQ